MEEDARQDGPAGKWITGQIAKKGLRPRFAAYVIGGIWFVVVIAFGVLERIVDPNSFPTIWSAMWWAVQTVTTVGYGDVVPGQTAGKFIAAVLMIVGLSFLAVVTALVTSAFVAQAQEQRKVAGGDPVMAKLEELSGELESLKAEVVRLQGSKND